MKSFKIIICLLMVSSLLCACMKETNLKDLTVIEGVAVNDNGENVEITIQSLNFATSTGTERPQGNMTVNTTQTGDSISDAITNLSRAVSKELFFGQNKIILFSKEVCENNFENKLDYILRFTQSRADVAVCMVDGDVKQVIENTENDSHIPIENLVYLIYNGEKSGNSVYINTNDLLNAYSDKTSDMFLPVVKERYDKDNSELSGIAVFSGDKLAYVLSEEETLGFSIINAALKNCFIEINDEKLGVVGVELNNPRINKSIEKNGDALSFEVCVKSDLVINEIQNGVTNRLDADDLERIVNLTQQRVNELVYNAYFACKKHKSDALRVGEYLARDYPKIYSELSSDWYGAYENIDITPKTKLKITKISDNIQLE